jgi:Niemann-Pick C1 protein
MGWYAKLLLHPITRTVVILGFGVLTVSCARSAANFTERFDYQDALPRDSYVSDFVRVYEATAGGGGGLVEPYVYFRHVDFSRADVRAQMRGYVADLAASPAFAPPRLFWLDFFEWHAGSEPDLNFTTQMDNFLADEIYSYLFGRDIARDERGNVVATRVQMHMNVDTNNAKDQIAAMKLQEAISLAQPINADRPSTDLSFFCYDRLFKMWEFLKIVKRELIDTTLVSVLAVTITALVFIPHWSAVCFVLPLTCILFVDLLGVLQWAGLHINPATYILLAMSIGLLVDYLLHILFHYYEVPGNRHEKTVATLKTMGASVLLGGVTTWLGTVPLLFGSTAIVETVFITFLGIVVLGMCHGLVLLPVLLSLFGPEVEVSMRRRRRRRSHLHQPVGGTTTRDHNHTSTRVDI